MKQSKVRPVVFQPNTHEGLQRGINQMLGAIRPTLGPHPRNVAIQQSVSNKLPELLDNGGVIARRIIQLPNRDADMGAMLVRQLLWQLHEEVGDGTATAAVLFQSIYNQGVTYLVSGGNSMRLRHYLEQGMQVIVDQLTGMTAQVRGKEELARVAESICYDPALAKLLGEIFDIIGEHGRLEIRTGRGRELEREYVEGMYWDQSVLSRQMFADQANLKTEMANAALLITELEIEDPRQLVPAIGAAIKAKFPALLIVAKKMSDSAIALLLTNKKPEKFQLVAVKTPGFTVSDQAAALEDLATLTGGRPFIKAAGDTLDAVKPEDLGRARRVWVHRSNFGIVGGKGNPRALRQHIANLRSAYSQTEDGETRKKLQQRIGKLLGGSAVLWVGGSTELNIKARKDLAERTGDALRGAIMEGVLPGGGMALLACRPSIQSLLDQSTDPDARAAYRILLKALETPLRTILENAGYEADEVMAQIKLAGPGHGFDVNAGQIVDMAEAGIFDVATAQKAAVRGAITTAALALTVDVLVHHKNFTGNMKP